MTDDEAQKTLHKITDKIHDLLNSDDADNGAFIKPPPAQGTVRLCFDMPKAWVLLGALVEKSYRNDAGELVIPPLEFLIDENGEFYDATKRAAKQFYQAQFYYHGHELLHEVFHMMPPPFSEPQPRPANTDGNIDDEIPF